MVSKEIVRLSFMVMKSCSSIDGPPDVDIWLGCIESFGSELGRALACLTSLTQLS